MKGKANSIVFSCNCTCYDLMTLDNLFSRINVREAIVCIRRPLRLSDVQEPTFREVESKSFTITCRRRT
jgi:hypothetical protein